MKNKVKVATLSILAFAIIIFGIHKSNIRNQNKNEQNVNKEKITLNSLGVSASGEQVINLEYNKKIDLEKIFTQKADVYKIKPHEYSKADINKIMEILNDKINNEEKSDDTTIQYELNNGGNISYYENDGGITYISNSDTLDETKGIKFDKEKCKRIAEDFIKKSDIIKYEELELQSAYVGETVETSEGEKDISYVLYYMKKSPYNMEYYGVGPGIKILIDSNYEIAQFTSINKEILKKAGQYETIDADEAVKKIIGNKGVQIAGVSVDEKLDVSVDKIKVCLYSDPLGMQQKYFAPYYVMSGKDGNNEKITIVVTAIENKNVIYK